MYIKFSLRYRFKPSERIQFNRLRWLEETSHKYKRGRIQTLSANNTICASTIRSKTINCYFDHPTYNWKSFLMVSPDSVFKWNWWRRSQCQIGIVLKSANARHYLPNELTFFLYTYVTSIPYCYAFLSPLLYLSLVLFTLSA